MSVLIKGMEMPKSCNQCALAGDGSDAVFSWSCPFVGEIYKEGCLIKGRLDDCPLVGIPTPHGRLIDAGEILNKMNEMEVEGELFTTAVNYVKLIISDAPTIIEAEGEE